MVSMRKPRRLGYYIEDSPDKAVHVSGFPWRPVGGKHAIGSYLAHVAAMLVLSYQDFTICKVGTMGDENDYLDRRGLEVEVIGMQEESRRVRGYLCFRVGSERGFEDIIPQIWAAAGGDWVFFETRDASRLETVAKANRFVDMLKTMRFEDIKTNVRTMIYSVDQTELVFRKYSCSEAELMGRLREAATIAGFGFGEEGAGS